MSDMPLEPSGTPGVLRIVGATEQPPLQYPTPPYVHSIGDMVDEPIMLGAQDVCLHENAVPVELLGTRECVAKLCPDCDKQLPADWIPAAQARLGMLGLY